MCQNIAVDKRLQRDVSSLSIASREASHRGIAARLSARHRRRVADDRRLFQIFKALPYGEGWPNARAAASAIGA